MRADRAAGAPAFLRVGLAALILTGGLTACAGDGAPTTVVLSVQHSAYSPARLTVPAGQEITFELRNDDPIDHEWIVGDEATHARHRDGSETAHDDQATEVTVPALGTRTTRIVFDTPGEYRFVCHLPGHEAYGMVGVLHVV